LEVYFWIALTSMLAYAYCMGWMLIGLFRPLPIRKPSNHVKIPTFSVIIPFKNELERLPILIESIEKSYAHASNGLVEIICIDDHSTDVGLAWLKEYMMTSHLPLEVMTLGDSGSGKKSAIAKAVQVAKGNYIITTDADCEVPLTWFEDWSLALQMDADVFVGVVLQRSSQLTLSGIQQEIESVLLQGMTKGMSQLGRPQLCSGANLGYRRDKFKLWNPYEDNLDTASGDDMFLLQKALENKAIIAFADTEVYTPVAPNWERYCKRSVRWSGKLGTLSMPWLQTMAVITFLANLFFLIGLFVFLFEGSLSVLLTVLIKFFVDFFSLFFVCMNFNRLKLVIFAPFIALSYPVYLLIVGGRQIGRQKKVWS